MSVLSPERIEKSCAALADMLGSGDLSGTRFLDIGSGSGLSSLAARKLGAQVHSFDYDPDSVACTAELRRRYFDGDPSWTVERGSVLDRDFVATLGSFDVVYAWGVLHHTGDMWLALENAAVPLATGGRLFIAIYNDCGPESRRWVEIKARYNRLPRLLRLPYAALAWLPYEARHLARSIRARNPRRYLESWTRYHDERGMSRWHDIIDWVGGHPYEYATSTQLVEFYGQRGLAVERRIEGTGLGCHEIVFRHTGD